MGCISSDEGFFIDDKNLAIIGFDDFSIGIVNQYIRASPYIGPVSTGIWRGQIT